MRARHRESRVLNALLLALTAMPGCARHQEPEPATPPPSADPALAVCTALSAPGPLAARFEDHLPLSQGGLLLVLGSIASAQVQRVFTSFGLADTRVVGCGVSHVVAWAPGVDEQGAAPLEAALLASAPGAKLEDRAQIAPRSGEPRGQRQ